VIQDSGIITTIAGGGTDSSSTGILATKAAFNGTDGVFVDKKGDVYLSEGNRVRKVDTSGIITTIAGTGQAGFSGDGGPATAAEINGAFGIYVDAIGNVYIGSGQDYRIRKVNTNGIISTIAGNGVFGESGNGGPSTAASIGIPQCITGDAAGNIYFADDNVVWEINTAGIINIIAGEGTGTYLGGYSGDGGPAIEAELGSPTSVSIDAEGNIYISSDYPYNVIRKINTAGIISTVAGSSAAADANMGGGDSGDGGPATAAVFNDIEGAFADSAGNIFIADERISANIPGPGNNKIRKVNTAGIISTVAGDGIAGFSGDSSFATNAELNQPWAVTSDKYGDIYIADAANNRIRKVTPVKDFNCTVVTPTISLTSNLNSAIYSGHKVTFTATSTNGGTNPIYLFKVNSDTVQNSSSNTYTTSTLNNGDEISCTLISNAPCATSSIVTSNILSANAGIITTIAGGGTDTTSNGILATKAAFSQTTGVFVDKKGNVYIASQGGGQFSGRSEIRKVNTAGIITTIAGTGQPGYGGDGGPATAAQINNPYGIYADAIGNVYIGDENNFRIRKVDTAGIITTIAGNGTLGYSGDGGQATAAVIGYAQGITGDTAGNIYFIDIIYGVVRKINKEGIISTIGGNGTNTNMYIGDGGLATAAQLGSLTSVSLDGEGNIYIGEDYPNIVTKINKSGIINLVVGVNSNASYPAGPTGDSGDGGPATVALFNDLECAFADSAGNIFIADENPNSTGNNKIRKVNTSGIISTIAGNGTLGFSGDSSFATNAQLNTPWAVITDQYGNIYIADLGNGRIRKVTIPTYTVKAGNWSDPTVWSKGTVPDAFTQVTINNSITVDINASAYSVNLQNNNLLKINPGLNLNIIGH